MTITACFSSAPWTPGDTVHCSRSDTFHLHKSALPHIHAKRKRHAGRQVRRAAKNSQAMMTSSSTLAQLALAPAQTALRLAGEAPGILLAGDSLLNLPTALLALLLVDLRHLLRRLARPFHRLLGIAARLHQVLHRI